MQLHNWCRRIAIAVSALSLISCGGPGVAAVASNGATHTVAIDGTSFQPAALTIHLGDTVVWVNKDPFPHTATSEGAFDSGQLAPGGTWRFVPKQKGELAYTCLLHRTMKGTLKVE
jgi:plastocyanin